MPWMLPAAIIGSSLLGGSAAGDAAGVQAAASDRAAELQRQSAQESLALQKRMYEEGVARQQPWLRAGENALAKLVPLATEYTPFGTQQFQADPGYAFRLSEGQKALERSAAARGGLLSGATGKALTRYGQEMGSQEYQNAFNRYQTERAARMQPLQSLAGVGQTTANTLGAAGQTYAGQAGNILGQMATNVGEAIGAAGQARASGYMGGANALSGGLTQYLNFSNQQAQNALLQQALSRRSSGIPSMTDFWDR